jgi:hypothetical protein
MPQPKVEDPALSGSGNSSLAVTAHCPAGLSDRSSQIAARRDEMNRW